MSHLWDPDIPKHWWVGNGASIQGPHAHLSFQLFLRSAGIFTKDLVAAVLMWQLKNFETIGQSDNTNDNTNWTQLECWLLTLKISRFTLFKRSPVILHRFFSTCVFFRVSFVTTGHFFPLSTEHQQSQASCDLPHLLSQGKPGKGKGARKHIPPKFISHIYPVGPMHGIHLPTYYIYHKDLPKCRYKYQTSILWDLTNSERDWLWDWQWKASWIRTLMICFSLKVIPTNRSCIVRFWGGNLAHGILKVQGVHSANPFSFLEV